MKTPNAELGAFLAKVLEAYLVKQRAKRRTLDTLMLDFEPDPTCVVKRNVVHEAVAKRFNRAISNDLVLEIHAALELVPGVLPVIRSGSHVYRGLKIRTAPLPT